MFVVQLVHHIQNVMYTIFNITFHDVVVLLKYTLCAATVSDATFCDLYVVFSYFV
jgi:hypothetical protein